MVAGPRLLATTASLSLFSLFAALLLSSAAGTTSPALPGDPPPPFPILGHCQCRCCHRVQRGHIECDATPKSTPLPLANSCDSRPSGTHDPTVCSVALCDAAFPALCAASSYIAHTCVSDRGVLLDWAPLAFVSLALFALAYFAGSHVSRRSPMYRPADIPAGGYKRDPVPEPNMHVLQPLLAAPHRAYGGPARSVEVLDVAPRPVGAHARRQSAPPPAHLLPETASVPPRPKTPPPRAGMSASTRPFLSGQLEEVGSMRSERAVGGASEDGT